MNSDDSSIRPRGQRSITSTFLSTSSTPNRSNTSQGCAETKIPKADKSLSLSDFLNRKLHRGCVLPISRKGKEGPAHDDVAKSNEVKEDPEKRIEEEKFPLEFVLEQFKCNNSTKEEHLSFSVNEEVGYCSVNDIHGVRKRKNSQSLIVIGDDQKTPHLKSKREKLNKSVIVNKKPRHSFNHYGNGRGWWNGSMEGVDNEEVGSIETWEGVGSSTLGLSGTDSDRDFYTNIGGRS